jgi:hypothetical protein
LTGVLSFFLFVLPTTSFGAFGITSLILPTRGLTLSSSDESELKSLFLLLAFFFFFLAAWSIEREKNIDKNKCGLYLSIPTALMGGWMLINIINKYMKY